MKIEMKTAGILGAAVALGVFLIMEIIREMHTFRVVHYCIESPKLMGMKRVRRAAFLTDLHNYCYGENNARLYKAIADAKPDVIFIGGDMLVRKDGCSFEKTAEFLGKLPEICDVYCANGNHEQKLKEWPKKYRQSYQEYRKLLTDVGIIMLENDCAELLWDEANVKLTGLEIPLYGYSRFGKKQIPVSELKRRIGQADESYQILLAHNPDYMDQYLEWGADLVLSGHLHGGIVRLPWVGGVIAPNFTLFPKYSGGHYRKKDADMVVSRGLGAHSIPIRLWNPAELVVVEFQTCGNKKNPV